MVVLLAIAGGVAAVLLSRGQQATTELQNQNISIADNYTDSDSCINAGFVWNTPNVGKCN